jgi:predicted transcriptional regulator
MTKETVQKMVDALPDEVTIDDIVERLMLIESFEEGRRQYEAGNYVTHEEMKTHLDKWLK